MEWMKRNGSVAVFTMFLLVSIGLPQFGQARQFKGVDFPDEVTIAQQTCKLNGIGVREKFFLDIYYGALYLQHPSQNPIEVISSDEAKRVVLHVVYKQVDSDKWVEGWREGFAKSAPQPDPALQRKIDEFVKTFSEPVRKGEEVQITYVPATGTEVTIRGQKKATIPGQDFMKALWGIWFGKQPASESLMKGMLGR